MEEPINSAVQSFFSELVFHDWLFLLALAVACLLLLCAKPRTAPSPPPGPPALPIIGHLHLLGRLPHQSICKLSRKYGPLMRLRLGRVNAVVASSPEMAKAILHTHDLAFAFAYRPRTAAAVHLCFDCSDVAYAPPGPHWKSMRQLYATELFNASRMEAFRYVREEEVRELARSVLREGDGGARRLEIRCRLVAASNNINCRMAMGKKLNDLAAAAGITDLQSIIEKLLHLLGVFYLGDYIPWLAWIDPNGYLSHMKAVGQRTKALLRAVIDERRRESKLHETPRDLLNASLALSAAASSSSSDSDISMTDDRIMAAIEDLFLGGSHTSAITVEWALADLLNNPKAMMNLQEELDNVIGKDRRVQESDIGGNLPYLEYVVKESMRLHPIVPFLIPREATREIQIEGYIIQPRTRIYVNTWAIGRDPSTWKRPLEFLPERFSKHKIDLRAQNFDLLPFGSGRRRCPGWALGLMNAHFMLATLVHGFTWEYSPESIGHTLDMSETFGLTVQMEKPLCVTAKPRLPAHVY